MSCSRLVHSDFTSVPCNKIDLRNSIGTGRLIRITADSASSSIILASSEYQRAQSIEAIHALRCQAKSSSSARIIRLDDDCLHRLPEKDHTAAPTFAAPRYQRCQSTCQKLSHDQLVTCDELTVWRLRVVTSWLWNTLPIQLRHCDSLGQFKRLLKTYLFGGWDRGALWHLLGAPCINHLTYLLTYLLWQVSHVTSWLAADIDTVTIATSATRHNAGGPVI